MRSFQPSNFFVGVSWVIFHLKPSLRNVANCGVYSMIQVFSYPLGKISFHLFVDLKQAFVFGSGRISPQFWEVFHKPTTSLFVSLLFFFQQFRSNLLGRVLSKLIRGRSWHFLLHSVIPMIYLLFFLPEALWRCALHPSRRFVKFKLFSCLSI